MIRVRESAEDQKTQTRMKALHLLGDLFTEDIALHVFKAEQEIRAEDLFATEAEIRVLLSRAVRKLTKQLRANGPHRQRTSGRPVTNDIKRPASGKMPAPHRSDTPVTHGTDGAGSMAPAAAFAALAPTVTAMTPKMSLVPPVSSSLERCEQ